MSMSSDSIVGDGLAQSPYEQMREELEHSQDARSLAIAMKAMQHIERERDRLRAERDAARADALALATERNRWQAMYNDAMAELDAAGRACKAALLADYTHAPPGVYGTVRAVANRLFDAALREDKP